MEEIILVDYSRAYKLPNIDIDSQSENPNYFTRAQHVNSKIHYTTDCY